MVADHLLCAANAISMVLEDQTHHLFELRQLYILLQGLLMVLQVDDVQILAHLGWRPKNHLDFVVQVLLPFFEVDQLLIDGSHKFVFSRLILL